MKIVPIKINFEILYENRHLFTDDSHYNSLIISNTIDTDVNCINVEGYNKLENNVKYDFYADYEYSNNYILDKNGLYQLIYNTAGEWGRWSAFDNIYYVQCGHLYSYSLKFYNWEELKHKRLYNSQLSSSSSTVCILGIYI